MTQKWNRAPALEIDIKKNFEAEIHTAKGTLKLKLYPEHAPQTVNNFVFLARQGFYDGVSFHRVIPNFMIQGGDPTGSGMGGPGYTFEDEFVNNPLRHVDHVISMANAGPASNGSQFFITHASQPHLDGRHTVFGTLVEGSEALFQIRQGDLMERVIIKES